MDKSHVPSVTGVLILRSVGLGDGFIQAIGAVDGAGEAIGILYDCKPLALSAGCSIYRVDQ